MVVGLRRPLSSESPVVTVNYTVKFQEISRGIQRLRGVLHHVSPWRVLLGVAPPALGSSLVAGTHTPPGPRLPPDAAAHRPAHRCAAPADSMLPLVRSAAADGRGTPNYKG